MAGKDYWKGFSGVRQLRPEVASFESGMPFNIGDHRAGLYAFVESEDSHSFFKGVANRYKLGQIAFDMELSDKWRLQFGCRATRTSALRTSAGIV